MRIWLEGRTILHLHNLLLLLSKLVVVDQCGIDLRRSERFVGDMIERRRHIHSMIPYH